MQIPRPLRQLWTFVRDVFNAFFDDDAFTLSAALAYYTVFSFAPMLLIATSVGSYFFGPEAIEGRLMAELSSLLGPEAATTLQKIISSAYKSGDTLLASLVGFATLLFAATGVFNALRLSLNKIWEVKAVPSNGLTYIIASRFLSFSFVVGLGFLLMVTLFVNAVIIGSIEQVATLLPGVGPLVIAVSSWLITTAINTLIFLLLFRFLPDARARWKDLWAGAIFTALLFGLGRFVIGYYIGNSNFSNSYGAAGALITLLVWTYYNSLILFLGAEFTQVWAKRRGNPIIPKDDAVRIRKEIITLENTPSPPDAS